MRKPYTATFTWNATVAKGSYTIGAYAHPVPFETNTQDNDVASPFTFRVGVPGDMVMPFGVVEMKDIAIVAKEFGSHDPWHARFSLSHVSSRQNRARMRRVSLLAR